MNNDQKINQLPKDWKWVKLGEVSKIKGGKRLPKGEQYSEEKTKYPYLRVVDFDNMTINPKNLKYLNENTQKKIKNYTISSEDLYISIAGTIGRVGMIPQSLTGANLTENAAKITEIKDFDLKYLTYVLNSSKIQQQVAEKTIATTQPKLALYRIEKLDLPLPPKPIQQAIVSKIEELFSELDKGIEQLKTAQQQLKTYRQAVLKWAFEGKLTNENVKDGELPEGWKLVDLKAVCEIKRGKSKHRPRNEPLLYGGKYPFIQTGDIRNFSGKYITKYSQTYSESGLQQSKLWPKGTLCITIAANIGETAILGFDACFPDSVVGLVCNEKLLLNKYTNYYFISFKQRLEELAPATAQKNINVDILEKVEIPLAPIKEQHEIVLVIESRLSVAEKMEEAINKSLQQAEALRQSIMKKAFEGGLV